MIEPFIVAVDPTYKDEKVKTPAKRRNAKQSGKKIDSRGDLGTARCMMSKLHGTVDFEEQVKIAARALHQMRLETLKMLAVASQETRPEFSTQMIAVVKLFGEREYLL